MVSEDKQRKRRAADGAAAEQPAGSKKPAPASTGEEDFPRGGSDGLTAFERREATEAARIAVEQELTTGRQPSAKKPKLANKQGRAAKGGDADEDDALFGKGGALEGKMAKHVELLRAKTLHVGTRLWGMVLEVTPRGLVVSLPHGLRGTVAPSKASDVLATLHGGSTKSAAALLAAAGGSIPPLTDLFAVGQYVRCVVCDLSDKEAGGKGSAGADGGAARSTRHVALSLLLRDVQGGLGADGVAEGVALGACVRSVEDHGYTVTFGIKGTSGFLRKRDYEAQFGEGVALQVGGLVDVVVRSCSDKRNVVVGCAPGDVAAAVTKEGHGLGLDTLLPGSLINVKVRKVLSNGLLVSFFQFLHGTIDVFHLPPAAAAPAAAPAPADWRKQYTEGAKLRARLLYVDPTTKRAGLSLLPHLLHLTLPSPVPMLGSVVSDAQVQRVDGGGPGLLLALPLDGQVGLGYCHASNALDERLEREPALAQLNAKFKPGTKLPARVIGYRLMDGMAALTVRPSQVNAAVLSLSDLHPGMVVTGTVASVPGKDGEGALLVAVAEGVRGLVPPLHAAETFTGGKGKVKVKVGDKVEARVVEVNAPGRKLVLSLRKALLAPKAKLLAAAEQAAAGTKYHGLVTGIHDKHGVFVSFLAGLTGKAPHSELGLSPGQAAKDCFSVGQVVKASVIGVTPGGKIKLSLAAKPSAAAAADGAAAAAAPAGDALGGLQPGDLAEAVVLEVQSTAAAEAAAGGAAAAAGDGVTYVCQVKAPGGAVVRARLECAHLSDHPGAVAAFREVVRAGSRLGRVLVLERLEGQRCLRVSRKPSLLAAAAAGGAGALPRRFEEVAEGAIVPGYVASVTHDAVYVRFLGGLTGRSGLSQLSDVFVSDPRQLFAEGQSVRCMVATVDAARQRFTVSLRPSATASSDASYLLNYFREMQKVQALRAELEDPSAAAAADGAAASDPAAAFPLGSLAPAVVHEVKEYGIVCDMEGHEDLVGLIPSSHTSSGKPPGPGASVSAAVLNVVGHEGLVELSLKPQLVAAAKDAKGRKAAAKALKPGTSVEAVVEGIRPGEYLILSVPQHRNLVAYAAVTDYNTPRAENVPRTFSVGQHVTATVQALPHDVPSGRVLCHVPLTRAAAAPKADKAAAGGKGAPKVDVTPGSVVQVVVTGIQPYHLDVAIGGGGKAAGRIHVTEVVDVDAKAMLAAAAAAASAAGGGAAAAAQARPQKKARKGDAAAAEANGSANGAAAAAKAGNPLDGFRLQQSLEAVVLGRLQGGEGHRHGVLDLSLRPSRVAAAKKAEPLVPPVALVDLVPGQQLVCFVLDVAEDALWLGAGPAVRGRCAALDASLDPGMLSNLAHTFPPGTPVVARVLAVNAKRHQLDLSLIDPCCGTTHGSAGPTGHPEGALAMGRVVAASGTGVRVALGPKKFGKVALTDIHDAWAENALDGLKEGVFVRARVVGKDGDACVLSLRASKGGAVAGRDAGKAGAGGAEGAAKAPELVEAGQLAVGQVLCGYVKRCDAKGLFVALDRFRDGRIKLGNLSDGFIEDPAAAFPPGARLEGMRVQRVEPDGRLELSLRSIQREPSGCRVQSLAELKEGQLVSGRVRRVEKFGVFVEVEGNTSLVGLAHISELQDGPVKDINAAFKAKQAVRAVVTKIDTEARRLSLSLKPSAVAAAQAAGGEGGEGSAGGKAGKRKRAKDIDDEILEAAEEEDEEDGDGSEDEDEEEGSEEEGSEDGDGGSSSDGEGAEGDAPGSDVDVDDVEVSDEDDDSEEVEEDGSEGDGDGEDDEGAASGSEQGADDSDGEDGAGARHAGAATTSGAAAFDLTAPNAWGELLLLQDDPRAAAASGAAKGSAATADEQKGLSKGQKKRLKEQREQEIRAAELARLSGSSAPTTPADFERLVLASPSSSFVWIKYMAFHISLGDIDAARKVAQRALDSINYREQGEKFNVWVAWLNLENAYGQPDPAEAAMALLKRALQYTDTKKMYLAALGVFERSDRDELAEQVVKTLTKKCGGSCKVWERAIARALAKGDGEAASKLLERSLQSLPARKHIKALLRTALAEFRVGSAERGRGILEGVLRNHPKRLDIWNVYIDQELKTGEQQRIRALFERATHLPLPAKKMKFLFRRYLEYEKEEGDDDSVDHVKRRAMEFVEQSLKA